jgi:hypothetical protein
MIYDYSSRAAWAKRQHAVYGDEVPEDLVSRRLRDYATPTEWKAAVDELRATWREKGREMTKFRATYPEAYARLYRGSGRIRIDAWCALSPSERELYGAYAILQADRKELNAAYRSAQTKNGAWLEYPATRLHETKAPPLMRAIMERAHEAWRTAFDAWYATKRAERAKRPIDDAAWERELQLRRTSPHWQRDRQWQVNFDNPDAQRG